MPISTADGSGQLIKTNCRYLCEGSRPITTPPTTEDWAQHPALNMAMDGIAMYANWVSRVVMPIVFDWVDDHTQEMREKMGVRSTDLLPDDVDAVVKAAFEIVKGKRAYAEGRVAFEQFQLAIASRTWTSTNINPKWTRISERMREEIRETLIEESRPLAGTTA
jgi:hypothetical protein